MLQWNWCLAFFILHAGIQGRIEQVDNEADLVRRTLLRWEKIDERSSSVMGLILSLRSDGASPQGKSPSLAVLAGAQIRLKIRDLSPHALLVTFGGYL